MSHPWVCESKVSWCDFNTWLRLLRTYTRREGMPSQGRSSTTTRIETRATRGPDPVGAPRHGHAARPTAFVPRPTNRQAHATDRRHAPKPPDAPRYTGAAPKTRQTARRAATPVRRRSTRPPTAWPCRQYHHQRGHPNPQPTKCPPSAESKPRNCLDYSRVLPPFQASLPSRLGEQHCSHCARSVEGV